MESTIGWFLKESFSYSELFNNFDCGNILALKYTHAQKKKKKNASIFQFVYYPLQMLKTLKVFF